jgi:cystathionine gamma-synthase
MPTKHTRGFSTRAVHSGEGKGRTGRSVTTPTVHASTYFFENVAELVEHKAKRQMREEYGRSHNNPRSTCEATLAELESGEDAILLSSGMAAIMTTLFTLLNQGDHLVMTDEAYHKTREFCDRILTKIGVRISVVKIGAYAALEQAIQPNTKVFFSETPTNPHLLILDVERVAEIGKRCGIKTIIDSTIATPYNLQPLKFGVDLVIHSATKYLGGHNDLLAGVVVGEKPLIEPIREIHWILGAAADPNTSYLLLRGLKTLALRMQRHNESATRVAQYLKKHRMVKRVYYPGLKNHPGHKIAEKQMRGFGGLVSFDVGSLEKAMRFVNLLKIPYIAVSFGGVESLVEPYKVMASASWQSEGNKEIEEGLVRLSVGLEDVEDLIADIKQALEEM